MESVTAYRQRKLVEYDALRRRVWILGQRCHHGATGSLVAAAACLGLIVERAGAKKMVGLLAGSALMLHDWKDRSIWFELGRGSQQ
jgi:hypothetical protein